MKPIRADKFVLKGHQSTITDLLFVSRNILATASNDGSVRLWDVTKQKQTAILANNGTIMSLALNKKSNTLLIGMMDKCIVEWDLNTLQSKKWDTGPAHPIDRLAIAPDDSVLLVSGLNGGLVEFWDVAKRQRVSSVNAADHPDGEGFGRIELLEILPDGKRFLTVESSGDPLKMWNLNSRMCITHLGPVTAGKPQIAVSPGGKWFAMPHEDEIQIRDIESGMIIRRVSTSESVGWLTLSQDGSLLAGVCNPPVPEEKYTGSVIIWNTSEWKEVARLPTTKGCFNCLSFSPDGAYLAAGSGAAGERVVLVWAINAK
jgi:WD40 repeat protein